MWAFLGGDPNVKVCHFCNEGGAGRDLVEGGVFAPRKGGAGWHLHVLIMRNVYF